MHFLDILEILSLEMGQTSSFLLKKAFATWRHAFLSTSTTFYDIFAKACTEIKISRKWPMSLGFLFSFSHSFAAVIELPLDLLPVRILHRKHHWDDNFYHGVATVSEAAGNFAASFSLRFLSISMLILVRLHCQLITVTWVSLERSFNLAEV